jgi:hypothetical protein
LASKTRSVSVPGPDIELAEPLTAPISPLPATRTPTSALASVASSTVDVAALACVTVPTRPAPFSTVSLTLMPSRLPASIVTVSEYEPPAPITDAATIR